jgi:hypothetical protein
MNIEARGTRVQAPGEVWCRAHTKHFQCLSQVPVTRRDLQTHSRRFRWSRKGPRARFWDWNEPSLKAKDAGLADGIGPHGHVHMGLYPPLGLGTDASRETLTLDREAIVSMDELIMSARSGPRQSATARAARSLAVLDNRRRRLGNEARSRFLGASGYSVGGELEAYRARV